MDPQEQISQIYVETRDDVFRYLLAMGVPPAAAQDLAQESFLRLYEKLAEGEPVREPRAWLFRVAHNLGLNARARERTFEPFDESVHAALPERDAGVEAGLIGRERMARVERAVASLSPQQKQVLELRAGGLRYREIAATLDWALPWRSQLLKNWRLEAIVRARSRFPLDVAGSENLLGLGFDDAPRPDRVAGVPLWIANGNAPGGRRLNPAAFTLPSARVQGNLGRGAIRGFGFGQADLALQREFTLAEASRMEVSLGAYSALNRPAFGDPVGYLNSPFFGVSSTALNSMLGMGTPYSGLAPALQAGGARCLQIAARVRF
jgi:RNA polymerase sigma factor (sigma-70 family)